MSDPAQPGRGEAPAGETEDAAGASWEEELDAGLAGIESNTSVPADGLQPRPVILTSQNGSSLTFVRRRAQSVPKS